MNNQNEHIDQLTPELIEKYLKGELSNSTMHEVEKLMLHDDFDAEAMEGFESMDPNFIQSDVKKLEASVEKRIASSHKTFPFYFKIAASLVFVAVCTFLIIRWVDTPFKNNELSQTESENSQPQKSTAPTPQETKPSAKNTESTDNQRPISSKPSADKMIAENQPKAKKTEQKVAADENDSIIQSDLDVDVEPVQSIALAEEESVPEPANVETPEANKSLQGQVAGVKVRARSATKMEAPEAEIMTYQDFVEKPITGKVTSADDGKPLPGVNVIAKGTTTGTVTDIDGNYKISLPQGADSTLVFSFVGLASTEADAAGRSKIDVQMKDDVSELSEVVVSAYSVDAEDNSYESTFQASQPVDGKSAYRDYLEENLRYPSGQSDKGRVVVKFKVNVDGSLSDFEITRSMGKAFDEEALRLIKEGPKWNPALSNDMPIEDFVKVKVKFDPDQ